MTGRLITNTDAEARHPWPEDVHVQGGKRGLVVVRSGGGSYRTAFVEAFITGTFLRGEGSTVEEAEDACWEKYQRVLMCDGTGRPHGPFEPRHYENGSGFCTRCGGWFTNVCEPSQAVKAERLACDTVIARYGRDVPGSRWWSGLVQDETARLLAEWNATPAPEPTTVPPTDEEYTTWLTARLSIENAGLPLGEMFARLDELEGDDDEDTDGDA